MSDVDPWQPYRSHQFKRRSAWWLLALLVVIVAAGASIYAAVRLPSAPDAVWARAPVDCYLSPKPETCACSQPDMEHIVFSGWWAEPPGHVARDSDLWDDTYHLVLECETPLARRVFFGRNQRWTRFADYRSTPQRIVVGGVTWIRYERDPDEPCLPR